MQAESVQEFRESWKESQGDSFADQMMRRSLTSLAHDVPELGHELALLRAPEQEQLALHLDNGSVRDHTAPAGALSRFMANLSEAVKAVTKDLTGRTRLAENLFVTAPAAGSVMLKFHTPAIPAAQATIDGTSVPSPDSEALRLITQVLASSEDDEDALGAAVATLGKAPRSALKHLGETIAKEQWTVSGQLDARGREAIRLSLSPRGADRLVDATASREVTTDPVSISGTMDGWAWSTGALRFQPDHGRAFVAHVPTKLQTKVARLVSDNTAGLTVTFNKTTESAGADRSPVRTTYAVLSIDEGAK